MTAPRCALGEQEIARCELGIDVSKVLKLEDLAKMTTSSSRPPASPG